MISKTLLGILGFKSPEGLGSLFSLGQLFAPDAAAAASEKAGSAEPPAPAAAPRGRPEDLIGPRPGRLCRLGRRGTQPLASLAVLEIKSPTRPSAEFLFLP